MTDQKKSKHDGNPPSPWVERFAGLVPAGGRVLDLACGSGRHTRFFLDLGHPVVAVDRDVGGLVDLTGHPDLETLEVDLETGAPWPLGDRRFAGIVVTNYLHRPLFPDLLAALSPGGVLIYETFAVGHELFSRPRNPDFLLKPGELLDLVQRPYAPNISPHLLARDPDRFRALRGEIMLPLGPRPLPETETPGIRPGLYAKDLPHHPRP